MSEHERWSVCTCARLDCWHEKGRCDEPPIMRFGVCATCKTYNPRRCKTCGQVIPEKESK